MHNKIIRKHSAHSLAIGLLLCVTLQGCASTALRPVSEDNKYTSSKYNGNWQSKAVRTASKQYAAGGWELTCADLAGSDLGTINVNNGVATLGNGNNISTTFVNKAGKFRFEIPTTEVAAAHGTSDFSLNNTQMKVILHGSLKKESGKLTFAIAEFGHNGCTTKVAFNKV